MGWTINVSKENINQVNNRELGIYESTMGRIKTTENIPKIDKDCKLHFDGKHYYIIIPEEVQKTQCSKELVL